MKAYYIVMTGSLGQEGYGEGLLHSMRRWDRTHRVKTSLMVMMECLWQEGSFE